MKRVEVKLVVEAVMIRRRTVVKKRMLLLQARGKQNIHAVMAYSVTKLKFETFGWFVPDGFIAYASMSRRISIF